MKKLLIPFCLFFIVCMIIFPEQSYHAAQNGLNIWWEIIIPALLPFFIIAELLLSSNAIHYLGYALAPLMRPIFRLPGEAALALVMGYSSGFPTGAAITAGLREKKLVTQEEGERLISFTNNASPLFISVSVATGILHSPQTGLALMAIHYGSNLFLGFLLRFKAPKQNNGYIKKSFTTITQTPQHLGTLLKNSAQKAGGNIAIIGCYIIFFSVLTSILQSCGLIDFLEKFNPFNHDIHQAISLGIWEMTLGINAIGDSALDLSIKLPICAALMAWGGISVQAQVSAMVSHTDIKIKTYLINRIFHAIISLILTVIYCRFFPQITKVISTGTANFSPSTSVIPVTFFLVPIGITLLLTTIGYILKKTTY